MLRNNLYSILLLSSISSLFNITPAFAERVYGQMEPPHFKMGRLAVKYEMDRFQAKDNFFKGDGDLLGSFKAYNFYLGVENSLSLKRSFSTGFLFGLSKSTFGKEVRRNINIKGLQFGINQALTNLKNSNPQAFHVISDLKFFINFYENSYGSDDVSLGDGTGWLQAGIWTRVSSFKDFYLWLYGGVNWPFKELSKNFVFILQPEFKLWNARLSVGLKGQTPIIKDKAGDNPTNRLRITDEYNGGSLYYQPINPKFIAANVWFGFNPAPLTTIKMGFSENLFGSSAPRGLRVFMTLKLLFYVIPSGHSFPYIKINRRKSKIQNNNGPKRLKNYANPHER